MGRDDPLDLPDLGRDEYLHRTMFDIGPMRSNGIGAAATDWDVILPFATAKALDDEDTDILAQMCTGYASAWHAGKEPGCVAPVHESDPNQDLGLARQREDVNAQLKAGMQALADGGKGKGR